jgi:hypothetical protein
MTDVPFPISRAYNSAPPTGTRLSLGVPVCPPFSLAVEPEGAHAAHAHARIARTARRYAPVWSRLSPFISIRDFVASGCVEGGAQ